MAIYQLKWLRLKTVLKLTLMPQTPEGATFEFTSDYVFDVAEMVMDEVTELEGQLSIWCLDPLPMFGSFLVATL
jgi:hypothetical protein